LAALAAEDQRQGEKEQGGAESSVEHGDILQPEDDRIPRMRTAAGLLVLLLLVLTAGMVFIPAWTIHPFKPQTPEGLEMSYALRRAAPVASLVSLALALALAAWLWRGARWWWRSALVLAVLVLGTVSWFARQNHFEWMFAPLSNTARAPAAGAGWVEAGDMVLAVDLNGESVAYPIRQVAYHHIVQDTVGGVPIAATY
jgi:hypothetical protein